MQEKVGEKVKTNLKILIASVVTILISVSSCYVLAETLINSKDVVYEDNSNLVADNVQDAIDGTCSKIDTRLSDIEDKLYIVKDIHTSGGFINSINLIYTGVSVDLPANSYCTITASIGWNHGKPLKVLINKSSTESTSTLASNEGNTKPEAGAVSATYSAYISDSMTVYIWARYDADSTYNTTAYVTGYCATKYK